MALVSINGTDHVSFDPGSGILGQVSSLDSAAARGQVQGYRHVIVDAPRSFFGDPPKYFDGARPLRLTGTTVLGPPFVTVTAPPRPTSGFLYPRRTQ